MQMASALRRLLSHTRISSKLFPIPHHTHTQHAQQHPHFLLLPPTPNSTATMATQNTDAAQLTPHTAQPHAHTTTTQVPIVALEQQPPLSQQTNSQPHQQQLENDLQELEKLLGFEMSSAPVIPPTKPVVIIISGPSGVGKDALVLALKEARKDLYFVVTATSRPMRPNEEEGRDYFFVDREKFEGWIRDDMLLEHANVYGDYKGIPRQQVDDALKAGTDVVLRIDVQGAATVKRIMPDAITIFVAAESERSLVTRLAARKTEDLQKLALRVSTARNEMLRAPEFDYVVENGTGKMEQCVMQMSNIIESEKARTARRFGPAVE